MPRSLAEQIDYSTAFAVDQVPKDGGLNCGEFFSSGHAKLIDDPATRRLAVELATYTPADRYVLYELDVERAASTIYTDGQPVRHDWKAGPG